MQPKIGLKRDSISSIGNNLFGFVLGSATAIIGVLAYGNDIALDIGNGGTLQTVARILPLLGIIVLLLYYLIDWYDLNLAVYIDEFVGRKQVCLYVISALVIGALPALTLGGDTAFAAILAAVYFPLVDKQRDRLLHEGSRHLVNREDLLSWGDKRTTVMNLRGLLWIASGTTLGMALWSLIAQTPPAMLGVAIALVSLWLVACTLKVLRSVYFLQPEYERRLVKLRILDVQEVPASKHTGAIDDEDEDATVATPEDSVDEIADTPLDS